MGISDETQKRPKVYIAGPITKGDRDHNLKQFMEAHVKLMRAGFAVFNPGLTMLLDGEKEFTHEEWLECCLPWVECADAIVRLPGESVGADAEIEHAKKVGVQWCECTAMSADNDLQTPQSVDYLITKLRNGWLWCLGDDQCPQEFRHRWPDKFPVSNKSSVNVDSGGYLSFVPHTTIYGSARARRESKNTNTASSETVSPGIDQIPFAFIERLGGIFAEGEAKYGRDNWKKGNSDPSYERERLRHAIRHLYLWADGDTREDHLTKVAWFCCTQIFRESQRGQTNGDS